MKKNIKKIIIGSFLILATIAIFTITINHSSLDSLRANALVGNGCNCKCVQSQNSDCRVGNNIMSGYKEVCKETE